MNPEQRTELIDSLIQNAIINQPRSRQRAIGPSEIGNPCDHCLAARLAGWVKHETETPWLTVIGTAMHSWLENQFNQYEAANLDDAQRWITEGRVCVGSIDGQAIWGSTDLVDVEGRMTVDWKVIGDTSLQRYRTAPSPQYRIQAHLYARGWNHRGIPIETVSIRFLPRNKQLRHGYWWHEPYQPKIAEDALARAERLAVTARLLAEDSIERRDQWITRLPRAQNCWDCNRYDDMKLTLNQVL